MKKIKKIEVYQNGKIIKNFTKKLVNNIPHIIFHQIPQKRKVIKIDYYRTPEELKDK